MAPTRAEERSELRALLIEYLEQHDGQAPVNEAVRDVALVYDINQSHATAAMWSLVGDQIVTYDASSNLTLVTKSQRRQPEEDVSLKELRRLLRIFCVRRGTKKPYIKDDVQRATQRVLGELNRLIAKQEAANVSQD